jgi:CBS domain-containing protein
MKVRDIMTKYVVMIRPDQTVDDAARLMNGEGVTCLLVVRPDPYKIFGLVTRFDIIGKVVGRGLDPRKVEVFEIVRRDMETVAPDDEVVEVASKMFEKRYWRMPVEEDGRIIGIVSGTDIWNKCLKK